ncbi:efflux RND transporter periplasmic adaptor subunit [Sulfurovum sp.]|uniref:efflux RND transporter periplasmic adaptor subunit n=1 Tax=Sulfurovum sp. TaxID=1969726 RepID=UPI0025CD1070|nr:efflux RND transporter periplasmic adaptor subunit [Sulfurovum sp.]
MQKWIKYIIAAVLVLIGIGLFYRKVYIPKTTYATVKANEGNLSIEVYGIGNVGAKYIYSITAQTGGRILSILTDEGKWVKKGDLLITVDSVDVPQLLEEAKISMNKARSEFVASQKELESLLAQKHLAQITYARYAKLKKQSFASKAEYDKAKSDLAVIEAQMAATRAHIKTAQMEIARSQKAVEALREKLSRYKVYAPADGYVIDRGAEVAQTVLPSQPVLQVVDPRDVWVKAYIDEKISGNIRVGEKADIMLRSQPGKHFAAVVRRIAAQSDPVTQEREVDVAFDKLPIPFYMNEQAEVNIETKQLDNVLKIPAGVLVYQHKKSGVWVEENGKAHFKTVQILSIGAKEAAVKGLDKKTKIIVDVPGKKTLKEGMSVH